MGTGFFLTSAGYYGTLAAARCLGEAGVPVALAVDDWLAPAAWSRWVSRRVAFPGAEAGARFIDALRAWGKAHPGWVLYPSSDDAAWLLAQARASLSEHFRLYQPPLEAVHALLDKARLAELCHRVGIATPRAVFPTRVEPVDAGGLDYPLLIKPRSQVLLFSKRKGVRVASAAELPAAYAAFVATNRHAERLLRHDRAVALPMLQEYLTEAHEHIHSVAGFIDERGEWLVARGATKVLQQPRKLGVGLCFEHEEADPAVLTALARLCRAVGYYGAFEVEWVRHRGEMLLLDFNPRFYGQMGFETARGLPLPLLVYHAARGDRVKLAAAVERAREWRPVGAPRYSHRMTFETMLTLQRWSGRMSSERTRAWRAWYAHGRVVDAVDRPGDRLPVWADRAALLRGWARHPRSFVRTMVLDR